MTLWLCDALCSKKICFWHDITRGAHLATGPGDCSCRLVLGTGPGDWFSWQSAKSVLAWILLCIQPRLSVSRPVSRPSMGKYKPRTHSLNHVFPPKRIALDHCNVLGMQERWEYQPISFWSTHSLKNLVIWTWSLLRESVVAADAQVQHEYDQQTASYINVLAVLVYELLAISDSLMACNRGHQEINACLSWRC